MKTRDDVKSLLQKNIVPIIFIKADGTERHMFATLDPDLIRYEYSERSSGKNTKDLILSVWDTVLNEFRSFRWDRLREVDDTKFPKGL